MVNDIPLSLPEDIKATQREQFLALLSQYSGIIAKDNRSHISDEALY